MRIADVHDRPLPWHESVRAEVAAAGGVTLQTNVEPVTAAVLRAHIWRFAAGQVLCTPAAGSGAMRTFSAEIVRAFSTNHVPDWLQVRTADEVEEVVARVTATVLAEHEQAEAARPEDERRAAALDDEQRRADRRAELERARDAAAAELAALDDGAEPLGQTGEPAHSQPRRRWRP
ncbi:hypothetical protein [Pseudonocardia alni]|uniref:hypothetical protein n=1 Tax=Pseudonocardia alni TaxID=33907 RepID=UPI0033185DDD